jgi:hypothetical protein
MKPVIGWLALTCLSFTAAGEGKAASRHVPLLTARSYT